jgi:hypothetical protein
VTPAPARPTSARAGWADRLRAAGGIIGPVAFSVAWWANGRRQRDYPVRDEHISGLAALDADHPWSMMAGFVVLGIATIGFAWQLQRALGGRRAAGSGPALLLAGGTATAVAGLLRRDAVLLNPPDRDPGLTPSWHNYGHDLSSGAIYATSILTPLVLARRFAPDPAWSVAVPGALAASAASVVLMVWFATDVDRAGNGVVQRVMVTVPQVGMALAAARVLALQARPAPAHG